MPERMPVEKVFLKYICFSMGENWDKEQQTPSIRQLPNTTFVTSAVLGIAKFSAMKVFLKY